MIPSPPIGSLVNVSSPPLAHLRTTHSNQFANISRERMPPNRLNGFPVSRCLPLRMKGSISFRATAKFLNLVTGYFIDRRPTSLACSARRPYDRRAPARQAAEPSAVGGGLAEPAAI